METPRPPETAEFGAVVPGGPAHHYPVADGLDVTKLSVGPFDNNVYIVRAGGETLLIDAANDADRLLQEIGEDSLVAIVETHGHFDHVQALGDIVKSKRCPVYAHAGDAASMPVATTPMADGDVLSIGGREIRALHTPGHTPGSICVLAGSFLFSGDALFPGGPGNTEGDPARFAQAMDAIEQKMMTLPDDTRVCPGHGLDTFIGREREYVSVWRRRGW
jgi:glyoxylase-like metal-dependent hydrolase (beta-lactamase superfamily II)